jgi:hypothetical protein
MRGCRLFFPPIENISTLREGEREGDEKLPCCRTLISTYFHRQMVLYSSVAKNSLSEGENEGGEKVLYDALLVLTFASRCFYIPLLQNSLSEGESEGDEKLLEDALEESFSVLEEKEQEETAAPVFRQEQLVSPPKESVKKRGNFSCLTLIPGSMLFYTYQATTSQNVY